MRKMRFYNVRNSDDSSSRFHQTTEKSDGRGGLSILKILTIANVLMGLASIVAGCYVAIESRDNSGLYVLIGIGSGLFIFTLASVTAACAKYINKRD